MILNVTDRSGKEHALKAIDGWRVMEIIRDHGMDNPDVSIKAECGGALACATCHVYVDDSWTDKIPPASDEEQAMMEDSLFTLQDNSRLCCQILMGDTTDGLKVTLAPESAP